MVDKFELDWIDLPGLSKQHYFPSCSNK